MAQTTTNQQAPTCHFGCGPAVATLTYIFQGATRRTNYRVCAKHDAEFSREGLVAERRHSPAAAGTAQVVARG